MRILFAGTPDFAAVILHQLLRRGSDVRLVLTQPDAPAGRGLRESMSPVKRLALERGIAVQQPVSLKDPAHVEQLARVAVDVFVVAAYGLILPQSVLQLPPLGCLNVHASLLPRWRGAAPIQRAIMAGDTETGVCIMRMEAGLDTGPVYLYKRTPIRADDTAGSVHDRLAQLGAEAVSEVLDRLGTEAPEPVPQPADGVTYASKIVRADARIDWNRPAAEIERLLRALDPMPGAHTEYGGQVLKLWRARLCSGSTNEAPGTVLSAGSSGVEIRCSDVNLVVTELQRPGGRRMAAEEFLRGFKLPPGARFGA